MAGHDVGVHIDRINRVGDAKPVLVPENVENVSAIALGTVRNENLVIGHIESAMAVFVLSDGLAEEVVAVLGAVAPERLAHPHLVHRAMHGGPRRLRKRFSDVANSATDHPSGGFRVRLAKGLHAPADLRKEITRL